MKFKARKHAHPFPIIVTIKIGTGRKDFYPFGYSPFFLDRWIKVEASWQGRPEGQRVGYEKINGLQI